MRFHGFDSRLKFSFLLLLLWGNTFREKEIWSYEVKLFLVTFLCFIFLTPFYTQFFFQSIINKMGSCYLRYGICTLKSVQRETAFSSVIGSLAPNSYSWKISKCRMISNISVGSDRWRVRCLLVFKKEVGNFEGKTRTEIFK